MKAQHTSTAYSVYAPDERNDCGVRALMVAACITYDKAHHCCEVAGRRNRDGMSNYQMDSAIRYAGIKSAPRRVNHPRVTHYTTRRIGNYILSYDHPMRREYYPTLAQFIAEHPRGHFIVNVPGHYVAVCDGVVHDWELMNGRRGARSKRGVRCFWQLV